MIALLPAHTRHCLHASLYRVTKAGDKKSLLATGRSIAEETRQIKPFIFDPSTNSCIWAKGIAPRASHFLLTERGGVGNSGTRLRRARRDLRCGDASCVALLATFGGSYREDRGWCHSAPPPVFLSSPCSAPQALSCQRRRLRKKMRSILAAYHLLTKAEERARLRIEPDSNY
jgi:hypothetical protein